jgi:uncharacterized protein YgiM (DUF1202 family)
MKRIILVTLLCLAAAGGVFAQKAGATMYVNVKNGTLKTSTGFFAGNAGSLAYGEQVTILAVNGKWSQVRSASRTSVSGWIASASLTTKRVTAQGTGTSTVSDRERALAGKGFSEEVEKQYKIDNKNLNYAAVDSLEKVTVPQNDLLAFINEGHLFKGE